MMRKFGITCSAKVQQSLVNGGVKCRSFNNSAKRLGGGHSQSHSHHHPKEPYAPHHHATYPNEAHLFGINPHTPYKSEGWEWLTLFTYAICFGVVAASASNNPTDAFNSWAREEAIARQKVRENGGEIEFGKIYNTFAFTSNEEDEHAMPVVKQEE